MKLGTLIVEWDDDGTYARYGFSHRWLTIWGYRPDARFSWHRWDLLIILLGRWAVDTEPQRFWSLRFRTSRVWRLKRRS